MSHFEVNFDGLVGPTHNYAGLSHGNLASMRHRGVLANPKSAALQGLAKMRALHEMGVPQAFLPPLERPSLTKLREFGFAGSDADILRRAQQEAPGLLRAVCSASAMWTANSATFAPGHDTLDAKTHITTANLISNLHRSLESDETAANLRRVFSGEGFRHHGPLRGGPTMGDEGAANHTRLAPAHSDPGLHLFVYGHSAYEPGTSAPGRFVSRQTLEASKSVARLNQLPPSRCCFLQQSPAAIDAGVFHNDVIATGNEGVLLHHELAFADGRAAIGRVERQYEELCGQKLLSIEVPAKRVSLAHAVDSYLFNSQLVTLPDGAMCLIAPEECEESTAVRAFVDDLVADPDNPIRSVRYFDLRASMRNGGGPACLRLRVVLDPSGWQTVPTGVKIDDRQLRALESWVERHYRDALAEEDLADPALVEETRVALDALTEIMGLPGLYSFQR